MKKIFFFVILPFFLFATEYFVSPQGDDTNNSGTSASAPFRTIQKAADLMKAGDICTIAPGLYEEAIRPANSGTQSAPILFTTVHGGQVETTASKKVTGWSKHNGNIYVADMDWDLGEENCITYNGSMVQLARWPNKTNANPFAIEAPSISSGNSSSITYNAGIPNQGWANGGVLWFMGVNRWTSWREPIRSHSGNTIGFDKLSDDWQWNGSHSPSNGGEFFLMNTLGALDANNEWYYDKNAKKLYLQTPNGEDPSNGIVLARARTLVFNLKDRSYITLHNLKITGGNIDLNNATGCVVKNCEVLYGNHTIGNEKAAFISVASISISGKDNIIEHSSILWGAGNGIVLNGEDNRVKDCYIGNFNYIGSYACPIELSGKATQITRCEIFNGGRDNIRRGGNGSDVSYNDVHHSNLINDDCGTLYFCSGTFGYTRVHHNWFHSCSSRGNKYKACALYMDNNTKNVILDHNVVWDMEWTGIQINWEGENLLCYNNTLWCRPNGSNSNPMGAWYNGYVFKNVRAWNNLSNKNKWEATSIEKNCIVTNDDPFEDFNNRNFVPKQGSAPIDYGKEISGYTDGFIGSAPDAGAYERGGEEWTAGITWDPKDGPYELVTHTTNDSYHLWSTLILDNMITRAGSRKYVIQVPTSGMHSIDIMNIQGKTVRSFQYNDKTVHTWQPRTSGVYMIKFTNRTIHRRLVKKVIVY